MTDVCWRCNQPILEDQPRYTVGEWKDPPQFCHYDCHDKASTDLRGALSNVKVTADKAIALIERLKRERQ